MRILLSIIGAGLGLLPATALAGEPAPEGASTPVNQMCPIGKEPINERAGTIQYEGRTVGFCCPSCAGEFMAWDEGRRDEFLLLAAAGREPGHEHAEREEGSSEGEPEAPAARTYYPLETCPVSGMELGSMGDPVVRHYDGREVRFCCAGCIEKFEANKDEHLAKMDATIVERQLEAYPLETCVVSGEKLGSMGEPVSFVHANRLVRFCCSGCIDGFTSDPAAFHAKLDKAYADAQRESYPLETCVVSGMKLGSMGEPHEIVAGTTLVRFCCDGCVDGFWEDPQAHVSKIEEARR